MKKNTICLGLAILAIGMTSCEESLPDHFGQIEGIFFNNRLKNNTLIDNAAYTFIYEDNDQLDVPVRIQLVGRTSALPRPVEVRVKSSNAAEGADFTLPSEAVLPAGATSMDYVITLKRTAALKQQIKTLEVELQANEHFIIPFTHQGLSSGDSVSVIHYKIDFSDQFTAPPVGWNASVVGKFSEQKFELLCDVMQAPRSDFNEVGKISFAKWMFYQSQMISYVQEQELLKATGKPYDARAFDKNGRPLNYTDESNT